jgi:hypothetical protein
LVPKGTDRVKTSEGTFQGESKVQGTVIEGKNQNNCAPKEIRISSSSSSRTLQALVTARRLYGII